MTITRARLSDCHAIAELAMIAGEGIPAYFWEQSKQPEEDIHAVGARNARSETDNFSYRNAWLARVDNQVAAMLLAYRLPAAADPDNPEDYPEFIRPLIELENQVPESFYINMLASYPQFRNQGLGAALMEEAERQAVASDCRLASLQVFAGNQSALRFYQRIGYSVVDQRDIIPHECFHYTGQVLLLSKTISDIGCTR